MYSVLVVISLGMLPVFCSAMEAGAAAEGAGSASGGATHHDSATFDEGPHAGTSTGAGAAAGIDTAPTPQQVQAHLYHLCSEIWQSQNFVEFWKDKKLYKNQHLLRFLPQYGRPGLVLNPDTPPPFTDVVTSPVTTDKAAKDLKRLFALMLHPDKEGPNALNRAFFSKMNSIDPNNIFFHSHNLSWLETQPKDSADLDAAAGAYRDRLAAQQQSDRTAPDWATASPLKRVGLLSKRLPYSEYGEADGMVFEAKRHAPELEADIPEVEVAFVQPARVVAPVAKRNKKIREFNQARPGLLADAESRFNNRFKKSTPRKYFDRADAFGVNPGLLGDVADVLTFDSSNPVLMAAGAAASVTGKTADAFYGRGAVGNSRTLEQEQRLNQGLYGQSEFNLSPSQPGAPARPVPSNQERLYEKADMRLDADRFSQGISFFERQVAQPALGLYDHMNMAVNAKATLAYNKFLALNKDKPAVRKYMRRLRLKKGVIFAMMAIENILKASAFWSHTRRRTDPALENPDKADAKVVSNSNMLAALGAAVGLARRGFTTYVKHTHVSAANDHADATHNRDFEDDIDAKPVHEIAAEMVR
jgi:hypothetical protein